MRVLPSIAALLAILLGSLSAIGQNRSANPHGVLSEGISCIDCHQTDTWKPRSDPDFDHDADTTFPLTGGHARTSCRSCHEGLQFDSPEATIDDCATCHVDVHLGEFEGRCQSCHNTTSFSDVDGVLWHNRTRFPLTGSHTQISCASCHNDDATGSFSPLDTDCLSCHEPDYEQKHGLDGYPTTCDNCHNTLAWEAAPPFDHLAFTGRFELIGAHQELACSDCHGPPPGLVPLFHPAGVVDCYTCHQSDYQAQHGGSGFPTTCADCHSASDWDDADFSHSAVSDGFDLVGAHTALECAACHAPPPDLTPLFNPTSNQDCFTCHQSDYQTQHAADGYPTTCLSCHDADTWTGATFSHGSASAGFELLGAHESLACLTCHAPPPDFTPLFDPTNDQDCFTCHKSDYQSEHAADGYPTTCLTCHDADAWSSASFSHSSASGGFDLLGAHDALACLTCHAPPPDFTPLFDPTNDQDCYTCHQSDYQAQHSGSGFPTTCADCHGPSDWGDADFSHSAASNGFDLVGAHTALECSDCHGPPPDLTPLFNPSSDQDCFTCHKSDYQSEHAADGYPTTCLTCHDADAWSSASFSHSSASGGFELLGAHDALACLTCHAPPPDFTPLFDPSNDQDCYTCHQSDYQAQHSGSGFPTTCADCHGPSDWGDADFSHSAASNGFDLLGAHTALECSDCHGPPPALTPLFNPSSDQDCFTCHKSDYQSEHAGTGFPTTCLDCHSSDSWSGATFSHGSVASGFDLVGAHVALECSACHAPPPDFTPLFDPAGDDDCFTCHQSDYQSEHGGSGYPTTCLTCHSTDDWDGADFNHDADYFPIFSGKHRQEWNTCSDCHANSTSYAVFSCLNCHKHNQAAMNSEHREINGYTYDSVACLSCHPDGDD